MALRAGNAGLTVRIAVATVPAIRWPYEMEALFAESENDRDVACGRAVTGPELDACEAGFAQFREVLEEAEDRRFLLGDCG